MPIKGDLRLRMRTFGNESNNWSSSQRSDELNQVFVTVLYERNTVDLTWWVSTASNLLDNRVVPEKRPITLKVIKRSDQTKFL